MEFLLKLEEEHLRYKAALRWIYDSAMGQADHVRCLMVLDAIKDKAGKALNPTLESKLDETG